MIEATTPYGLPVTEAAYPGSVQKFGLNPALPNGVAEDIWDGSNIYPWPAAAAATTIQSSSVLDDNTPPNTGMLRARVLGLDANFLPIQEDVDLNGVGVVALANAYLRVYQVFGILFGGTGLNQGNVTVQHGATVIAQVTALRGQTLMAIYTIPVDGARYYLVRWRGSVLATGPAANVEFTLFMRESGAAGWRTQSVLGTGSGQAPWSAEFAVAQQYAARTDIRVSGIADAVGAIASAEFDLVRVP